MGTYHAVRRGIVADGAQLNRFGDYSHASYGMSTIRGDTPCTAVSTAGQTAHRRRARAARASSARRSGLALDERRRTDVQHGAGRDLTVGLTEQPLAGVLA